MKFHLLTQDFFDEYSNCSEMLLKKNRPYIVLLIKVQNLTFAIPVRSNITHKYSIKTIGKKGIDFSKAVVINDYKRYISNKPAYINREEYHILVSQKWKIEKKMKVYIEDYKMACQNLRIPANFRLCKSSTLQYFHKELKIE